MPGNNAITPSPDKARLLIKFGDGCVDLAILPESLKSPPRGGDGKYECALRCFIRSGRRYFFNGAVESGVTFSFTLRSGDVLTDLKFDGYRSSPDRVATYADFADLKCTVPMSEENGTPLAEHIGLQLADERNSLPLKISFRESGRCLTPLFERRVEVLDREHVLRPFQFLIDPAKLRSRVWKLVQSVLPPPAPATRDQEKAWRDQGSVFSSADRRQNVLPPPVSWRVSVGDIPAASAANSWNHQIADKFVQYVRSVQGDQRLSFFPRLVPTGAEAFWQLDLSVWEVAARRSFYSLTRDQIVAEPYQLVPAADQSAVLSFEGVTRRDGQPLQVKASILQGGNLGGGTAGFQARLDDWTPFGDQKVLVGALDLQFGWDVREKVPPNDNGKSTFTAVFVSDDGPPHSQDVRQTPSLKLSVELYAAVNQVDPGGQDPSPRRASCSAVQSLGSDPSGTEGSIARRFESEPALLIPLPSRSEAKKRRLRLTVNEQASLGSLHRVRLRLTGPSLGLDKKKWMVIDRNPFLIAAVDFPDVRLNGSASTELAVWDSGDPRDPDATSGWLLYSGGEQMANLRFPPQAVGEEMIKREDQAKAPTLDFRFSPAAQAHVRTTRSNYAPPPWNLRRLLGYPGQQNPGSELLRLETELLYGLATTITLPKTANPDLPLRIAEFSSRLGDVQPCLPPGSSDGGSGFCSAGPAVSSGTPVAAASRPLSDQEYRLYWAGVYSRFQSRLAALEIFRGRNIEQELELTEGLEFRRRALADQADPTYKANPTDPNDPDNSKLHGGVDWGFEFKASYLAFTKDSSSTKGHLRRAFVSSLGGYGFQKASFAKGIISIYSDTAMGRLSYYSVEELGRIACYWNKAKHVVVYERTVSPSCQFKDSQPDLKGRFLVRKVLEYIEILEPIRCYPDQIKPDQITLEAARAPGFLEACEFKSKVIRVDSSWGSDIYSKADQKEPIGFKIPLWRNLPPSKDPGCPDVYPRPTCFVQLSTQEAAPPDKAGEPAQTTSPVSLTPAAPGGSATPATPPVAQGNANQTGSKQDALVSGKAACTFAEIDEPEKLIFYSLPNLPPGLLVRETLEQPPDPSDTNRWPALAGIDGSLFDDPKPPDFFQHDQDNLDNPVADDEGVQPGFHMQTFALRPSPDNVNVLSRRSATGALRAPLRNITVSRKGNKLPDKQPQFQQVLDGLRQYRELSAKVRKLIADGEKEKNRYVDLVNRYKKPLDDVIAAAKALNTAAPFDPAALCDQLRDTIVAQLNAIDTAEMARRFVEYLGARWAEDLKVEKTEVIAAAHKAVDTWFKLVSGLLAPALGFGSNLQSELNRLTAQIQSAADSLTKAAARARAEFEQHIRDDAAELIKLAEKLSPRELADEALRRSEAGRQEFLSGQTQLRSRVTSLIETLSNSDLAIAVSIGAGVTVTLHPIDGLGGALASALGPLASEWQSKFNDIASDWAAADKELRQKLQELPDASLVTSLINLWSRRLTDAAGTIGKSWEAIVGAVAKAAADVLSNLDKVDKSFISELIQTSLRLQKLRQTLLDDVDAYIQSQSKALQDFLAKPLQEELEQIKQKLLDAVKNYWDAFCKSLLSKITDAVNDLIKSCDLGWLKDIENDLTQAAKTVEQKLAEFERKFAAAAQQLTKQVADTFDSVVGQVAPAIDLLRAFGGAPVVPQLNFNIGQLAYYFRGLPTDLDVGVRPIAALFNRIGDDLKGLGLRLPTIGFAGKIIPDSLPNFNFGDVIPDVAGLKRLLQGAGFDKDSKDFFEVTHGVDVQSRRAWAHAKLKDMPLVKKGGAGASSVNLFALPGLLRLQLNDGKVAADADASVAADGKVQRSVRGSITADWALIWEKPEMEIVRFEKTAIRFDESGHLSFDIGMDRVKLNQALSFLTELLKTITVGSGFSVDPQLPTGIRVHLDIAFPNVSGVTSGIQDLTIGMALQLNVIPEFTIGVSFYAGQRKRPFTCVIFILGGTGWCEVGVIYRPLSGRLDLNVDAGIGVSASLQIALGPISGQVGISLSFALNIQKTIVGGTGEAGEVSAGLRLHIWGEVSVLGIISAGVYLDFIATYAPGCLKATGSLEIHISIAFVINIDISKSITFTLGSCSGTSSAAIQPPQDILLAWAPGENAPPLRLPARAFERPRRRLPLLARNEFSPFDAMGADDPPPTSLNRYERVADEYLATLEEG